MLRQPLVALCQLLRQILATPRLASANISRTVPPISIAGCHGSQGYVRNDLGNLASANPSCLVPTASADISHPAPFASASVSRTVPPISIAGCHGSQGYVRNDLGNLASATPSCLVPTASADISHPAPLASASVSRTVPPISIAGCHGSQGYVRNDLGNLASATPSCLVPTASADISHPAPFLSLIHIPSPRDQRGSRMPSSA